MLSVQVTEVSVHAVWDRNFVMRWIMLARVYVECGWRFWFWWIVAWLWMWRCFTATLNSLLYSRAVFNRRSTQWGDYRTLTELMSCGSCRDANKLSLDSRTEWNNCVGFLWNVALLDFHGAPASVPVHLITWKDWSWKWPVMCRVGHSTLFNHSHSISCQLFRPQTSCVVCNAVSYTHLTLPTIYSV